MNNLRKLRARPPLLVFAILYCFPAFSQSLPDAPLAARVPSGKPTLSTNIPRISNLVSLPPVPADSVSVGITSPRTGSTYRKGKAYRIAWAGGAPDRPVTLELYYQKQQTHTIAKVANSGSYQWKVPATLKPGPGYRIRISVAGQPGEGHFSGEFSIRRRIPLLLKALPVALGGAGAYLLLGKDSPAPAVPAVTPLPEPDKPR